ncbi:hypothetical protein SKAU_G00194610 [Synaphobranchus kaupii]|uniref:Uncharacterized protein n=1 Tax=Synaphobranchus kaupii TaxID=118154 RepID=A0A9Q1FEA1_SYNKA|nr:hypothetical protein SKAU_G00194610 [Synaphobranchus kaupii]
MPFSWKGWFKGGISIMGLVTVQIEQYSWGTFKQVNCGLNAVVIETGIIAHPHIGVHGRM